MNQNILKFALVAMASAVVVVAPLKAEDAAAPTNTGASAVTHPMTLDELVNEALQKNPELNFYRAEIAAAKGDRETAGAWANPETDVQIGQKRTTGSGASGEGLAWAVSVAQPFEFPGRLALRKAIANRQLELARIGYDQFQAALAARVRNLGYALMAAQQKMEAAQSVASRGQELMEVLVQRDPAGVAPLLESRIIEAEVITLKRRATEATKVAQATLFELNQLRGQPLAAPVTMAKAPLRFPALPGIEGLLSQAATNNFELRQRQVELEQQGFKLDLTKNERWPAIKVGPYISQDKATDTERTIGVSVSLPLPLWNHNKGNIQVAEARQQQAATSLLLSQRQVEREVRERYLTYQNQVAEMAEWQTNAIDQLREAAELGDRHYRLGALPIATYTELQTKYLEAQEAILATQADALESRQQLELLVGTPLTK